MALEVRSTWLDLCHPVHFYFRLQRFIQPAQVFAERGGDRGSGGLARRGGQQTLGVRSVMQAAYEVTSKASAKQIGLKLSQDPDMQIAIHDLLMQCGIGRRHRTTRLAKLIDANDLGIVAKGLDIANKLTGDYAATQIDVHVNYDPQAGRERMSELRAMLAEAMANDDAIDVGDEAEVPHVPDTAVHRKPGVLILSGPLRTDFDSFTKLKIKLKRRNEP